MERGGLRGYIDAGLKVFYVGLNKIAETVAQVKEMWKGLAVRPAELETRNKEAEKQKQQNTKTGLKELYE